MDIFNIVFAIFLGCSDGTLVCNLGVDGNQYTLQVSGVDSYLTVGNIKVYGKAGDVLYIITNSSLDQGKHGKHASLEGR
jgi:hypothetical protein